ncbi:cell pole-organizing protein PopZ [Arcanobacterium pluranimalium]|uniref:hypothetical protein n=1 Tax=Arcanobacterium pluranimalium TaxID=108028 RepID=UPI00195D0655|nr:hypothetical protein [Arcanobacterium pluranimalium]MBM7825239.1 cell pole-organizing protein PopZ [Arcanobacterium pluranimalium]
MSETPRLSRKELRELGKLTARESDSPSLSETAELRLRRPSRKELREAERSNATAEQTIMKEFAARSAGVKSAESSDEAVVKSPTSHAKAKTDDARSETDKNQAKSPVPSPSPVQRVSIAQHEALSEKSASSALSAESASRVANSVADEPKKVSTSDQPIRTSVFNRFDNDDEPKQPRSLRERLLERTRRDSEVISVTDSKVDAASPADAVAAADLVSPVDAAPADEKAEEVSPAVAQDSEDAAPQQSVTSVPDTTEEESAVLSKDDAVSGESLAIKSETSAESEAVIEPEASQKAEVTEAVEEESLVYEESGKRNWIGLLLLIAIGALVGYLVGSWVSTSFLSMGTETQAIVVGTTVFQL